MNRYQVFTNSTEKATKSREIKYCSHCGSGLTFTSIGGFTRQRCENCGFVYFLNPNPGVTIIIRNDDNEVLIGKRIKTTEYGDRWCLPGGYIEYEESFIDATIREVQEETGLSVELEGIINIVSNMLDDSHHTLVVVLLGKPITNQLVPGDDVSELKWIDKNGHASIEYAFEADKRIIDCFFEGDLEMIPIDGRYKQLSN